ncbi:unnamed protein product [Allacma fusca]|uniref:Chloride channel CLIC-like protein 1 n=1 Tax=Allacma fusca TaxID=39272 RepID=A0A8J2PJQ9_9HEXA|nr:unnamed protein product [Allacma fusca]
MKVRALSVLVALISSTTSSRLDYVGEYDEGFVDFTDMGSYNHGFQKNLNLGRNGLKPPGVVEEEVKVTRYNYEYRGDLSDPVDGVYQEGSISSELRHHPGRIDPDLLKSIEVVETFRKYKPEEDLATGGVSSMKFLKRVVASLLRQMNVGSHTFGPGEAITIDLQAEISHSDFMMLNKFVEEELSDADKYLVQVDSIISNMLHVVSAPATPEFLETIKEGMLHVFGMFLTPKNLLLAAILLVFLLLLFIVLWRTRTSPTVYHVMMYGFLAMILISCVWSFVSLYEVAKAENYARVLQTRDVPSDCEFERLGFWDKASYFFRVHILSFEDRCVSYHREVMVDPFWSVSPAEAVSQTFATLVFSPAGYIGGKLGEFFRNASSVFPWWLQPFVLVFMFVFVFLGVFRFRIKTPILSIEPAEFRSGNDQRNNMLPEAERRGHQQIAERQGSEIVEIRTRDACVDTSDFEEYLRSTSNRNSNNGDNSIPTLLPPLKRSFYQFLSSRTSLVFVVLSGLADIVLLILDKTLRQVPFVADEDDGLDPLQMDILG